MRQVAGGRIAELIQPAGALRLKGIADRVAIAQIQWQEDEREPHRPPPADAPARPITVVKDAPADRLLDAVRVAAAGDALLAASITRRLIEQFTRAARPAPGELPPAFAELTEREREVLRLIARGMSNAEI